MSKQKGESWIRRSAIGTGFFGACCFGLLGILGLLGFTTLLAYINSYGDYVLFPLFSAFATVLTYSLLQWKNNSISKSIIALLVIILGYFSFFGIVWFSLVLLGIVLGWMFIRLYRGKRR